MLTSGGAPSQYSIAERGSTQRGVAATVRPMFFAPVASVSSKVAIAALCRSAVYSTQQSGSLRPVVARTSPRRWAASAGSSRLGIGVGEVALRLGFRRGGFGRGLPFAGGGVVIITTLRSASSRAAWAASVSRAALAAVMAARRVSRRASSAGSSSPRRCGSRSAASTLHVQAQRVQRPTLTHVVDAIANNPGGNVDKASLRASHAAVHRS
jgi:hypothetical protein